MQSDYPEQFERDVGCSEAEWIGWMPRAIGGHEWRRDGSRITVRIADGSLDIRWEPLPERRIALLRMQRLRVMFRFDGVDATQRHRFMKPFDLSLQRGGG
jgi:hypothetical protein